VDKQMKINKETNIRGNISHISLIIMNVNGLYSPIKRHKLAGWIKKQDVTIYCLQEMSFTGKENIDLECKMEKRFSKPLEPENKQEQLYSHLVKQASNQN
jgi:exonuclease III